MAAKRKELKEKGKGNRPNAAEPVSSNEQAILRDSGVIGTESPEALLNTMWLNNCMLYGIRGGTESRNLRWGDIKLKATDSGREYLEYNERITKTRTAENNSEQRAFPPKQFAHSTPETCPVYAYKCFAEHRPQQMLTPDAPFYLAINHGRKPGSTVWYKNAPMGENSLRGLMKKMAAQGNLTGRKTNHSARKTTCTKLLHHGIAPTTIQQLSGHKNVQSVNNYAKASLEMQEAMSDILSENPNPIRPTTSKNLTLVPVSSTPSTASINRSNTDGPGPLNIQNNTLSMTCNKSENPETQFGLGLFNNAKMHSCTITINNYQTPRSPSPVPKRRRIAIIDSDSE